MTLLDYELEAILRMLIKSNREYLRVKRMKNVPRINGWVKIKPERK